MNEDFPRHCGGGARQPRASFQSARPFWTSEGRSSGPQRTEASWDVGQIATGPRQRADSRNWLPVIKAAPLALMLRSGCNLDPWDRAVRRSRRNKTQFTCIVITAAQRGAPSSAHKGIKTYDDWSAGSPARQRSAIWREQRRVATSLGMKVKLNRGAISVSYMVNRFALVGRIYFFSSIWCGPVPYCESQCWWLSG